MATYDSVNDKRKKNWAVNALRYNWMKAFPGKRNSSLWLFSSWEGQKYADNSRYLFEYMPIPALGTTHADYFYGNIHCTRELTQQEVMEDYETNTGKVIIETIENGKYDPMAIPGIVVKNHGPFAWGKDPANAVYNAVVMEKVAEMDLKTLALNPNSAMAQYMLDKHYMRKHGPNAYYGQK